MLTKPKNDYLMATSNITKRKIQSIVHKINNGSKISIDVWQTTNFDLLMKMHKKRKTQNFRLKLVPNGNGSKSLQVASNDTQPVLQYVEGCDTLADITNMLSQFIGSKNHFLTYDLWEEI